MYLCVDVHLCVKCWMFSGCHSDLFDPKHTLKNKLGVCTYIWFLLGNMCSFSDFALIESDLKILLVARP